MIDDSSFQAGEVDIDVARAGLLAAILERVGYTLWQLAECEDTAAHFLVVRAYATRGMGREPGEALLAKAQGRTFGSLLSELRQKGIVEGDLEIRLNALLEERNWLVHRSKRDNRGVLNDLNSVDILVARLAKIADEATALNSELGAQIETFVIESGVDPETIDQEARQLAESWGYYL
ncbi:MAG TPA: hypothetical protein VGQ98_06405 [Gemmatimonadaceae bacterium]|nr:hypothetical protein [Gemmatimonadaceae bacterium]